METRRKWSNWVFSIFSIQKGILQSDKKNGVICLVFMLPSWIMVLKLSEKVHFLQFCADISKKCKSIKEIYIYVSERSRYALSENGIVSYATTYCLGDIRVWSRIILPIFFWVNIFFGVLIANISWMMAHTPINHTIFWKSVM